MDRSEAFRRITDAPAAHLATITPDGRPHVVVITFALIGPDDSGRLVTAVDEKPKTTHRLQRLTNIETTPKVSVLVDHYAEDWEQLWWVRLDGTATVHHEGDVYDSVIESLVTKYDQYRERRPQGPAIVVDIERITSWASAP